jgi:hypothetical protein
LTQRWRRYEILLPLFYNNGSEIEPEKFDETMAELRDRFGGVTLDANPTRGSWLDEGTVYEDVLVRFIVDDQGDQAALQETLSFFATYKEALKERFQQIEVWITYLDIGRV